MFLIWKELEARNGIFKRGSKVPKSGWSAGLPDSRSGHFLDNFWLE